jgi:DNA-binding response OmpR family regulator
MEHPPANRHIILIIDDDLAILEAIKLTLEDAGHEVETSTKDGKYINERISKARPGLIILDMLLSGHDGRDISKRLKSQEETSDIPIVMTSAHPNARDASLEAGADDFLAKPFDIDELLDMVERYL